MGEKNKYTDTLAESHQIQDTAPAVNRHYKDTLFRMIFREKSNLLQLYNAVSGTDYTDEEDLEVVTLENAIYMNHKNDVAFLLLDCLNLYEHQSTYNPNMPLRNLFYISREYETSELELTVCMLNINKGYNATLMEQCKLLFEYMQYVDKVRAYAEKQSLQEAVERAVTECLREGILVEFLSKYRREAIQVSIYEYDEEKELRLLRQAERQGALEEGIERGIEAMVATCKDFGVSFIDTVERIVDKFNITQKDAETKVKKYW